MEKLRQNCDESAQEQFLKLLRSKDKDAFRFFCDAYRKTIESAIWNRCKRQDKEDLVQEILIKIYMSIDSYDPEKAKISTWVFNVSRNLAIDIYRKQLREYRKKIESREMDVNDVETRHEMTKISLDFIEKLSIKEVELLRMKYIENMTSDAIAQCLGLRKSTVKSRIHQIKEKVRFIYGADAKVCFVD